jgi:phosphatidylglycerophosphatase A
MKSYLFRDKICIAATTLLGIGFSPLLPGTIASLAAILIFFIIKKEIYFLIFTIISLILSYLLSGRAEEIFKEKDCKKIVIDDFSGMLISLLFIPHNYKLIIAGFFIFRLLDILKVPPADRLEKFKGSKGVVGDDLIAGLYTNVLLHCLRLLLKISS